MQAYVPNRPSGVTTVSWPVSTRGGEIEPSIYERGGMLDCHLMVSQPARHLERIRAAGGDSVTFHVEAVDDPMRTIAAARELGLAVGVAFNPGTPLDMAILAGQSADVVLCMGIQPGLSGQ